MRSRDATARRRERGAAIVEFMLVLPILLSLAIGVWEFGRVIDSLLVVTNAAREGARAAATSPRIQADVIEARVRERVEQYLEEGYGNRLGTLSGGTCDGGDVCLDFDDDVVVSYFAADGTALGGPAPQARAMVSVTIRVRVFQNYLPGLADPLTFTAHESMQL